MKDFKLGIIGCGNMGGAVCRALVDRGILAAGAISLNDKDIEKAARLAEETGCIKKTLSGLAQDADMLLLAVKPQDFDGLIAELRKHIGRQTVLSIMAGISIDRIMKALGSEVAVARAMPNMAASACESMTCVSFGSVPGMKEEVKRVLSGIGKVLEVEESLLDAVTALAGSGPAYLFYLAQSMTDAGCEMGLDAPTAYEMTVQTLYGAAALLKENRMTPQELIEKVASRGGTTEAALAVFKEKRAKDIIKTAVLKAEKKSRELSGGK